MDSLMEIDHSRSALFLLSQLEDQLAKTDREFKKWKNLESKWHDRAKLGSIIEQVEVLLSEMKDFYKVTKELKPRTKCNFIIQTVELSHGAIYGEIYTEYNNTPLRFETLDEARTWLKGTAGREFIEDEELYRIMNVANGDIFY